MVKEFLCKNVYIIQLVPKKIIMDIAMFLLAGILVFIINADSVYIGGSILIVSYVFGEALFVSYNNRCDPRIIKIDGDKIEVNFFIKFFFKKQICIFKKQEIESRIQNENIEILKKGKLSVKIRKNSMEAEDWIILKEYLSL